MARSVWNASRLAGAFGLPTGHESGSKLHALQTLREVAATFRILAGFGLVGMVESYPRCPSWSHALRAEDGSRSGGGVKMGSARCVRARNPRTHFECRISKRRQ